MGCLDECKDIIARRGPPGGYDFENKSIYRNAVWSWFAEKTKSIGTCNVIMLPSKEGLEINVAIKKGVESSNIIAIDSNPALLASAKWRKQYPKIKCIGSEIVRAADRISTENKECLIDIVNLDLCSNLNMKLLRDIQSFIVKIKTSGKLLVALTMLEGRESEAVNTLAELLLDSRKQSAWGDYPKRISVVVDYLIESITNIGVNLGPYGRYKSGRQMMVWGCFEIVASEYVRKKGVAFYKTFEKRINELLSWQEQCRDIKDPPSNKIGFRKSFWKMTNSEFEKKVKGVQEKSKKPRREAWGKYIEKINRRSRILEIKVMMWDRNNIPRLASKFFYRSLDSILAEAIQKGLIERKSRSFIYPLNAAFGSHFTPGRFRDY